MDDLYDNLDDYDDLGVCVMPPWMPDTSALIDPLVAAAQELGGIPIPTHDGWPA